MLEQCQISGLPCYESTPPKVLPKAGSNQREQIKAFRNRRLGGEKNKPALRFQRLLLLAVVLKSHAQLGRILSACAIRFRKGFL